MTITLGALIGILAGNSGIFALIQFLITRHDKKNDAMDEVIEEIKTDIKQMKSTDSVVMYYVFSDKIEKILDKGFADPDDRRDVENMFERYKANGWNGDMDARVAKVYALPTKRIKEIKK